MKISCEPRNSVLCDFSMSVRASIFKVTFLFDAFWVNERNTSFHIAGCFAYYKLFLRGKTSIFYFFINPMPFSRKATSLHLQKASELVVLRQIVSFCLDACSFHLWSSCFQKKQLFSFKGIGIRNPKPNEESSIVCLDACSFHLWSRCFQKKQLFSFKGIGIRSPKRMKKQAYSLLKAG